MIYEFPLPPSLNHYLRPLRGRMVKSTEAREYQTVVKMLAKADGATQLSGPVAVTVNIYRARAAGDLDNRLKVLLDSLQGVFYANDSQIRELHAYLDDDKARPRCTVEVKPIPPKAELSDPPPLKRELWEP